MYRRVPRLERQISTSKTSHSGNSSRPIQGKPLHLYAPLAPLLPLCPRACCLGGMASCSIALLPHSKHTYDAIPKRLASYVMPYFRLGTKYGLPRCCICSLARRGGCMAARTGSEEAMYRIPTRPADYDSAMYRAVAATRKPCGTTR
jgi:hypothetical protein